MSTVAVLLTLGLGGALSACTPDEPEAGADSGAADDGGAAQDGGAGGDGGGGEGHDGDPADPVPAIVAEATVTWSLDFDATAEAEGYSDCSYTRRFLGVQRLDRGYLCPDCAVIVRGMATVTDGLDCVAQIADPEKEREETWGWSADGRLFRTSGPDYPLGELSTFDAGASEGAALGWESEGSAGSGTRTLVASGTLAWAEDASILLDDPFPPQSEPYLCGWPTADPGDLALDYTPAVGATFPNVRLQDQCGQDVNLWDLYGSWLVLDTSQPDCGPCLSMAASAGAFVEEMAAAGQEVRVVSFLGNGLADPTSSPSASVYDSYVESYDHGDPVFVDEGFGYAWFSRLAASDLGESFGFPTWVVVDPTMTVVHGNVGFGTWDDVAAIIEAGG